METGGARVIPLFYDDSKEDLDMKFSKINGLLIPGGGNKIISPDGPTDFTKTGAYLI